MRVEAVIAIQATDAVGPTRLRLLTASSSKLPAVVVTSGGEGPEYHVFDVADLETALTNQMASTTVLEALDLQSRPARPAVASSDVAASEAGAPVVENGRLIGVVAGDLPEVAEPSEEDLARGAPSTRQDADRPKRGLWQRLSRPDERPGQT